MEDIKVSVFAAAIRPNLWDEFLSSVKNTSVEIEVIFAGHNSPEEVKQFLEKYPFFKYIHTNRIKPSQAYEAARRKCVGECVHWGADDAVYSGDILGNAYRYWKSKDNKKLILSLQTKENGIMCDMKMHNFWGGGDDCPLMAPLALLSREYFDELGGIDRRYVCGQYENNVACMAIADGGSVEIFQQGLITLDHHQKHGIHNERPFAKGYPYDREILEKTWCDKNGKVNKTHPVRNNQHEPFVEEGLLTKSQGLIPNPLKGMWV